jgi:hypothetical protein
MEGAATDPLSPFGAAAMPSLETLAKGVLITAVSLVVINVVKPYLPTQIKDRSKPPSSRRQPCCW